MQVADEEQARRIAFTLNADRGNRGRITQGSTPARRSSPTTKRWTSTRHQRLNSAIGVGASRVQSGLIKHFLRAREQCDVFEGHLGELARRVRAE